MSSSQTSNGEGLNHQKKGVNRVGADKGTLVESLSPNSEGDVQSSNESPNKLSKSKSDNFLRLFRRSSFKHKEKSVLGQNPIADESSRSTAETYFRSDLSLKTKGRSYKAFRSGTGPLILIQQPQTVDLKPDQNNDKKQAVSSLTFIQENNTQNSLKRDSDAEKVVLRKYGDKLISEEKSCDLTSVNSGKIKENFVPLATASAIRSSRKENPFAKYLPTTKEHSRKLSAQSKVEAVQNTKEKIESFKNGAILKSSDRTEPELSTFKDSKTLEVPHSTKNKNVKTHLQSYEKESHSENLLNNKGTHLFKKLIGLEKSSKLICNEPLDNLNEQLRSKLQNEAPHVNKISKLKEQWEVLHIKEQNVQKDKETIITKFKTSPKSKERTEPAKPSENIKFENQPQSNHAKSILKNEHRKLTRTANISEKLEDGTIEVEYGTKATDQLEPISVGLKSDKLPPKFPSAKTVSSSPTGSVQTHKDLNEISVSVPAQPEFPIDNESFHNQQSIREDQEKKILELHLKHLQEIQKLRSQAKDYRVVKPFSTIPDQPSSLLLNKRKQYSFTNEAGNLIENLPPGKLIRSVTYDNPSDFHLPCVDGSHSVTFQTNSLTRKNSKKYCTSTHIKSLSATQLPEQKFSFSNYLVKSRSNSIGEKDTKSESQSEKEILEVKIDLPKRVHFPDDSKLKSTEVKEKIQSLVNTDGRTTTVTNNGKVNSPNSKRSKVSILKRSNSVDDAKPISSYLPESTVEFPKDKISSTSPIASKTGAAVPVKPPRLGRALRKTQSVDEGSDMKQVMSSSEKKESSLKNNSSHNGKENSEPVPVHRKAENCQNRLQRNSESQKRKYQQESAQSEIKTSLTNETLPEKIEKSDEKDNQVSVRPPQPPSRGHKPYMKGQNCQITSPASKSTLGSVAGPLVTACKVGEEEQIMKLIRELSKTSPLDASLINQVDHSKRTPLSHACSNGFIKVVELLTAQPQIELNLIDSEGNTPLHYAAQGGHVDVVSHLVNTCNRQVDLDVRNNLGFTPLMKAALQGRTKIAKILLFAGASPHLRDYGKGLCAVEWAKYTGRSVCCELIDSVQRSCSNHIRDRWTSDPDMKISHSGSNPSLSSYHDNKDSWLKHKIKKAFNKSETKKEFNVASNLPTIAVCVSSPILPGQAQPQDGGLPKVQVTEVSVPDCYKEPVEGLITTSSEIPHELPLKDESLEGVAPPSCHSPPASSIEKGHSEGETRSCRNQIPIIEVLLAKQ